jgi:CRISPR-associated protein Cst2
MFGFMIPKKAKKSKGPEEETRGGALTRISPVKVSPAMGTLPFLTHSTLDFLTARKPQEKEEERAGSIVNVELGTNLYKCGLAVDMAKAGFEERIDFKKRKLEFTRIVPDEERKRRLRKVLGSLKLLADYSKQARLMTDFTPDIVCVTFQKAYSHRLQKLFDIDENARKINVNRLVEILTDLQKYSERVYFGLISNVVANESELTAALERSGVKAYRPDEVFDKSLSHPSLT